LESIVDPFVLRVGGERISQIVGNTNPAKSADYFFRTHNVIAELKSLQAGTFIESTQRKMTDLMSRWQRERKLIVYGTADSSKLSPECREEMFSVMQQALQKHVVFAANDQIKSTKRLLNLPDAKGLLWVQAMAMSSSSPMWSGLCCAASYTRRRLTVIRPIPASTDSHTSVPECSDRFPE